MLGVRQNHNPLFSFLINLYIAHLVLALKDEYPHLAVTAYLRNRGIERYLTETAGVTKLVYGTYQETEKLTALAKDHDIVINVGSSWDPVPSQAIIEGLDQRPLGSMKALIHMSGAGNFIDTTSNTGVANPNAKVWNVSLQLSYQKQAF